MPDSGPVYRYTAYGLRFDSQIELPFADAQQDGAPDVTVSIGAAPESLGDAAEGRGLWRAVPGRFLMRDNKGGAALVEQGRRIVVNSGGIDALRVFLTGSALTALLQQRGLATLHASSVLIDGQAVAFVGRSGVGKSTLAAEFVRRGFAMMADDVSALRLTDDRRIVAEPAYPHVNLWAETIEALGMPAGGAVQRMADIEKYLVPLESFPSRAAPLGRIYLLSPHERYGDFSMTPVPQDDMFRALSKNVHRKRCAMALGRWPALFDILTAAAAATPAFMVRRPRQGFRVAELADAVLAHARAGAAAAVR